MIKREEYLKELRAFREKRVIKVVSGIRRCGKSTLFDLFKEELERLPLKNRQKVYRFFSI